MKNTVKVIEVKNVSKRFKIYYDRSYSLKERMLFFGRNKHEWRYVLSNISFNVRKGEVLALIGHNGCGKSTMLKLLTKIMYPTEGKISITGRVSSLIELGAGFHPDMSGRENIFINAAIFGLTKNEIKQRLQDIIAFSELEEYIDNPVRTYSSGMYMRLAFSIAINVDADVLLVDEILAVGDANFQVKCFEKMRQLKNSGVTIVIVTHDLNTVERFCDRAIWINEGKPMAMGVPQVVISEYMRYMTDKQADESEAPATVIHPDENNEHFGSGIVQITDAYLQNDKGERTDSLWAEKPASIVIEYKIHRKIDVGLVFGIGVYTMDRKCIYGVNTQIDGISFVPEATQGQVFCDFSNVQLISGEFILQVAIVGQDGQQFDFYYNYSTFRVFSPERGVGLMMMPHEWKIMEANDSP